MHNGTTYMEILVEGIVKVKSHKGLALHAEGGLVLERDADVGARIDDTLVSDGHRTHVVVDSIVAILGEGDAPRSNHNRPTRHIHRVEFDGIARR